MQQARPKGRRQGGWFWLVAMEGGQKCSQPASRDNSIEDSAHTPRCSQSPLWDGNGNGDGNGDAKDVSLGQSPISPCALLLPVAFFGKRFINVASINKQTDAGRKNIYVCM